MFRRSLVVMQYHDTSTKCNYRGLSFEHERFFRRQKMKRYLYNSREWQAIMESSRGEID